MSARILVVDDEQLYRHLLKVNLETEGYEVSAAKDGEEALEMVSSRHPDLVMLDVAMPKLDGFETCERIRQFSDVPVIMLTARGEEQDRVHGLNVGADDYVLKPFSATELVARVRAVLRRAKTTSQIIHKRYFSHLNLRIDFARAEVWKSDHPVYLSATEYRLLIQFAQHSGRILAAEELLSAVWGESYREDKEILWVSIARLRQKLEDDPHNPQHIVTRSGLGYMMPASEGVSSDEKGL
ncbi:MAG TPA: response regulator transcription factor [Bellilinea sp.]|nr:response regulator transcription factor [Bellilinea sp.]